MNLQCFLGSTPATVSLGVGVVTTTSPPIPNTEPDPFADAGELQPVPSCPPDVGHVRAVTVPEQLSAHRNAHAWSLLYCPNPTPLRQHYFLGELTPYKPTSTTSTTPAHGRVPPVIARVDRLWPASRDAATGSKPDQAWQNFNITGPRIHDAHQEARTHRQSSRRGLKSLAEPAPNGA